MLIEEENNLNNNEGQIDEEKEIEVVLGDDSNLVISSVGDIMNDLKPKVQKRENIVIPIAKRPTTSPVIPNNNITRQNQEPINNEPTNENIQEPTSTDLSQNNTDSKQTEPTQYNNFNNNNQVETNQNTLNTNNEPTESTLNNENEQINSTQNNEQTDFSQNINTENEQSSLFDTDSNNN